MRPGLEEKVGKVDVACLPVNGRSAYKRDVLDIIGNFTASEAIAIASHLEASLMIPLHFDLYDVNSITVEELAKAAKETDPSQTYHVFKPKEVVEYQKQK